MSAKRTGTQPSPGGSQADRADPFGAVARRGDRCWSEFGWGGGLQPRAHRDKDPADGGRYRARVSDRARTAAPAGRRIR